MANHDVSYFKNNLKHENEKLINQCSHWQNVLTEKDQSLTENVLGEIRTAIGLTELLLGQKLKQFGGLIQDCENETGEIKVTCSDLQGFWEMVYHEVEKVNNKFKYLEELKENNWEIKEESVIPIKKAKLVKAKPNVQAKSNGATKAHILAARQRLAEAKANAMKSKIPLPGTMEGKENFICISAADSTVDDTIIEKPNKTSSEKKKRGKQPLVTPPKRHAGNKSVKEFIPLACVTRSAAKRALGNYNKS